MAETAAHQTNTADKPAPAPHSWGRELLETVSFVVILVLMLKAVVAEAFVIPTGSMATTLYGDHYQATCPACAHTFTINRRQGRAGPPQPFHCPNCQETYGEMDGKPLPPVEELAGDKVLVLKPPYDYGKPQRFDVIVFKYPGQPMYLMADSDFGREAGDFEHLLPVRNEGLRRAGGPQENYVARNFIKRLWGLPGEKLAIKQGKVFLAVKQADQAEETLQLIRKPPRVMLETRRLVHDNNHLHPERGTPWLTFTAAQPDPFADATPAPWQVENQGRLFAATGTEQHQWLRFRYRRSLTPGHPHLITNFMSYNQREGSGQNWVNDLMLEAEVDVQQARGELVLELSSGADLARAVFSLDTGKVLLQVLRVAMNAQEVPQVQVLKQWERPTPLHQPGKHQVRFANFDSRLTLWVGGTNLTDKEPCDYERLSDREYGPRLADLLPVGIGARQAQVKVGNLKVWRDTYYTRGRAMENTRDGLRAQHQSDAVPGPNPAQPLDDVQHKDMNGQVVAVDEGFRKKIAAQLRDVPDAAATLLPRALVTAHRLHFGPRLDEPACFYPLVHKDHHPADRFGPDEYFALGDNSDHSSDSRTWGQIPERLLVGKAILVYWPWTHWKAIK